MCQAYTCGRLLARTRVQVFRNGRSRMVVLRFTTKKEKIQERKKYKKRACQCTDKLGATQNGRAVAERFSTHQESNPNHQTHCYNCLKKTVHDSSYFAIFNWFFGSQDYRAWIFQVQYQGQTWNTRILERKPLVDTSYRIRHRLELKYVHFAQFLLNAHRAAHLPDLTSKKWELITWNLGQIFEIERWMVGQ